MKIDKKDLFTGCLNYSITINLWMNPQWFPFRKDASLKKSSMMNIYYSLACETSLGVEKPEPVYVVFILT